jgi:acetyl-CoA carboxylase biotin carboxyl carrier protein
LSPEAKKNDRGSLRSAVAKEKPRPEDGMEIREIKALLALMNDFGLTELEIEDKKGKIRLVRGSEAHANSASALPVARPGAHARAALATPAEHAEHNKVHAGEPGTADLAPNQKLVESPMVGTFYRAASPDSAPFVEEGSTVHKGQVLCIIEAMKMMNEIEAPAAGRVVRILVENGQPVEYGHALMILEVD